MKNLLVRTLTGLLFLAVMVGCILAGPLPFVLLFAAITGLTIWEFCLNVNAHAGASVNCLITTVAGVYLFLAMAAYCSGYAAVGLRADGSAVFIPWLLCVIYLPVSELYLRKDDPLKNWAYAFAAQIYVALMFSLLNVLAFLRDPVYGGAPYSALLPLSVFFFLWANDTGAYVFGSLLRKRFPAKLFERVSPNKSWVGSVGGAVVSLLVAVLVWHFAPGTMTLSSWLGLALVVCVFGTLGDLVESLFKRQLGVKDSGAVLPGHGGMLDRFDSTLLAIPAAVLYLYTLQAF